MSKEKKTVELNEKESVKVNAGGRGIGREDYCHYVPSKWALADDMMMYVPDCCGSCKYNPHRSWAQSSCEYNGEE